MNCRIRMLLPILAAMAACAPKAPEAKTPSTPAVDTAAIREAAQARWKALGEGNAEGYLSAYADDAVWMPPESEEIVGKAAARQRLANVLADQRIDVVVKSDEQVIQSPEWVVDHGTFVISTAPKSGAAESSNVGRYFTVWRLQKDKTWKIAYDIWNVMRAGAPAAAAKAK